MFNVTETVARGLSSMRTWITTISANIANAETTRSEDGGPYRRRDVVIGSQSVPAEFDSELGAQLATPRIAAVVEDQSPPRLEYNPGHPDADENGNVAYPNINVVGEMTNMMNATRAYEANLSVLRTARALTEAAIQISRTG